MIHLNKENNLNENYNVILMAGCAHNGIVNTVEQISNRSLFKIDYVYGGFHSYNLTLNTYEEDVHLQAIAYELLKTHAIFYTGHCTGLKTYKFLKSIMQDRIEYNSVGCVQEL